MLKLSLTCLPIKTATRTRRTGLCWSPSPRRWRASRCDAGGGAFLRPHQILSVYWLLLICHRLFAFFFDVCMLLYDGVCVTANFHRTWLWRLDPLAPYGTGSRAQTQNKTSGLFPNGSFSHRENLIIIIENPNIISPSSNHNQLHRAAPPRRRVLGGAGEDVGVWGNRSRKWRTDGGWWVNTSHLHPWCWSRDVAPSGLVCRLILTIAVKLFRYFSNVGLLMTYLFICAVTFLLAYLLFLLFIVYLKSLPRDFKRSSREWSVSSLLLNKEEVF